MHPEPSTTCSLLPGLVCTWTNHHLSGHPKRCQRLPLLKHISALDSCSRGLADSSEAGCVVRPVPLGQDAALCDASTPSPVAEQRLHFLPQKATAISFWPVLPLLFPLNSLLSCSPRGALNSHTESLPVALPPPQSQSSSQIKVFRCS